MKTRIFMALPLAATLMVPAFGQQAADQTQTQSSSTSTQSSSNANQDQNLSAHQPLTPESHEGFWGHLNPFARKKYVQRQMAPIRNRVNELDELTASNSKAIKDVDARAQEGIRQASAKANEADQHAVDAGNRAQQAQQTADQANQRLQTVQNVVTNIDQYQPGTQAELRFRPGQTVLSAKAKEALDQLADSVKDQRGYVIEVQGFAPGSSQASIANSQRMANSVVRYLVLNHNIPVYRIYTLGMGNATVTNASANADQTPQRSSARHTRVSKVEVTVLKNSSLDQLTQSASTSGNTQTQGGITGTANGTTSNGMQMNGSQNSINSNAGATPQAAPQQSSPAPQGQPR